MTVVHVVPSSRVLMTSDGVATAIVPSLLTAMSVAWSITPGALPHPAFGAAAPIHSSPSGVSPTRPAVRVGSGAMVSRVGASASGAKLLPPSVLRSKPSGVAAVTNSGFLVSILRSRACSGVAAVKVRPASVHTAFLHRSDAPKYRSTTSHPAWSQ